MNISLQVIQKSINSNTDQESVLKSIATDPPRRITCLMIIENALYESIKLSIEYAGTYAIKSWNSLLSTS